MRSAQEEVSHLNDGDWNVRRCFYMREQLQIATSADTEISAGASGGQRA